MSIDSTSNNKAEVFIDSMLETLRSENYTDFIKNLQINTEKTKTSNFRVFMKRTIIDDDSPKEMEETKKSYEQISVKRGILEKPNMRNYISIRLNIDTDTMETIPIKSIDDIIYTKEELEKMKVAQLDSILTSLGIKPMGSKGNKLNLIISYYQKQNIK